MKPKMKAMTIGVAGTALGAAGLGVLAMPAGAGEAPQLPPITAQALVQSVLDADPPALAGTVRLDNDLGLPAMPNMPALGTETARVYYNGDDGARISLQQESSERTIVRNDSTVWNYNSADNTATKTTVPAQQGKRHMAGEGQLSDPADAAAQFVAYVRESSTVRVDGTATVAERPAYELVLTPKPSERTVLREVRVAVDSETRIPLRLSVLTNGTTEPALELGFSDVDFGSQPAELFRFSPPEGTTVTEQQPDADRAKDHLRSGEPQAVGEGWDTVLTGRIPVGQESGQESGDESGRSLRGLLERAGEPVSGAFGSGHVVTTKVGAALITDDGRYAIGAVPQQVLTKALEDR